MKTVPSRHTTYAGGNNVRSNDWTADFLLISSNEAKIEIVSSVISQ